MKIYLAGAEGNEEELIRTGVVKNAFVSYYYVRKSKTKSKKLSLVRQYADSVIVDSGAHTFFSELAGKGLSVSVHKKKTQTQESPEDYFKRYRNWVKENYELFNYFVELDIGEIVGQDTVKKWRLELKQDGTYEKCITVYHPKCVSWEDYLEMLKDSQSKYIALEGDRFTRKRPPYARLIKPAYQQGIKVHGFAMVKRNAMEKYPFYSVDSTSWKAGCQYGASLIETNKGVKAVKYENKEDVFRIKNNKGAELLEGDKKNKRIKAQILTAKAYQKLEEYYTNLWDKREIVWK